MAVPGRRIFSSLAGLGYKIGDWWRRLMTMREIEQWEHRNLPRVLHDLNVSKAELLDAVIRPVAGKNCSVTARSMNLRPLRAISEEIMQPGIGAGLLRAEGNASGEDHRHL